MIKHIRLFAVLVVTTGLVLSGCSGVKIFRQVAQVGDTIAVPTGWSPDFSRDNINVYIYPAGGGELIYSPDDPAIRAVVNMYPDPISSIMVSRRTNQNMTPDAVTYSNTTHGFAGWQHDWFQTVVFSRLATDIAGRSAVSDRYDIHRCRRGWKPEQLCRIKVRACCGYRRKT